MKINLESWQADKDMLLVPKAGEMLYRVQAN